MKIKHSEYTDVGDREKNEDYVRAINEEKISCFVVADGLGGHTGGADASKIAAETIAEEFLKSKCIDNESVIKYFSYAHEKLKNIQAINKNSKGFKSTAVGVFIKDNRACIAHVGDSRVYFFRNDNIEFITRDHSVARMLVELGECRPEEIREHEDKNKLIKVLGMNSESIKCEISQNEIILQENDKFLLCTDGIWELISDDLLLEISNKSNTTEQWINNLKKYIGEMNIDSKDNYSCYVIIIGEGE